MFVALLTVVPQFESCTDAYICVFASWGCWRSPTIRAMQLFVSVLSWGWWGSITTISHADVSCVSVSWGHSLSHSDVCVNLCSFRLMALSPIVPQGQPGRCGLLCAYIVCGCPPDRPHYEPIRDMYLWCLWRVNTSECMVIQHWVTLTVTSSLQKFRLTIIWPVQANLSAGTRVVCEKGVWSLVWGRCVVINVRKVCGH